MFIKLGIIVGIVVLGGMIFSNEIDNLFPTTVTVADSLKDDLSNFGTKTSDSVEKRIDESIDKIVDKTGNTITNEISEAGDKISSKVSEAKESSQKMINDNISNFNPIQSIQNVFTGNSNSQSYDNSPSVLESTPNLPQNSFPLTFETLSLPTQQSDDDVLLQYSDSSGKTKSVKVVIRTAEKEIFVDTFFTSMFETTINDTIDVPYYVDMIIEHEDYGIVTSSVFNPGDSSELKINGIFSQK
jgi:gas vesicle protein